MITVVMERTVQRLNTLNILSMRSQRIFINALIQLFLTLFTYALTISKHRTEGLL